MAATSVSLYLHTFLLSISFVYGVQIRDESAAAGHVVALNLQQKHECVYFLQMQKGKRGLEV
jgi:hypothetical protein